MINKQLFRSALLLAVVFVVAACSNEDTMEDPSTPEPTAGKMMVSITGTIDDESPQTRSSFVYGESLGDGGAAGEKFQWNAGDKINLRFSTQHELLYDENVLVAPGNLRSGQTSTTFSGTIKKYTGRQTIYAVSPSVQIGDYVYSQPMPTLVNVVYPPLVIQKGKDLSHLGATDYMWARVKDFNLGNDGENLKNAQLNFEHLGAMLRFQIKNTSTINKYTLKSVTVREKGSTKILWDEAIANLTFETPVLSQKSATNSRAKTVVVEDAEMNKGESFDAYMMVPASPEGTDLTADDYRFIVDVVVTDETDHELLKEIEIRPAVNGEFMKNGFAAGKRYYFVISVDENKLTESHTAIHVANGGELEQAISDANINKNDIERLKVTGTIDKRDLMLMNKMASLYDIDLSDATIAAFSSYNAHVLPNGIFERNVRLRHIILPDNLKVIQEFAFYECTGLVGNLHIPDGVETIGSRAYAGCRSLTGDLTIPNSVTSIGISAFYSCSGLNGKLTLPVNPNFKIIGESAFSFCTGLTGDLTIPDNVESIGESAFSSCTSLNGKLTLPNNNNFTRIESSVFFNCFGLSGDLVIPNSVTSIGNNTFIYCRGFTGKLIISENVTSIGYGAFNGCSGFTGDLNIPNNVESIGEQAFMSCEGFKGKLTLPINAKFKTIEQKTFYQCDGFTGDLTIPNNVETIGVEAFYSCTGFKGNLILGNNLKTIERSAFSSCSGFTGSLTIPGNVETIGDKAFASCNGFTGSLTIAEGVESIGNEVFFSCRGFTGSLTIPGSVKTIGYQAFFDCSGFTSLTIDEGVESIGYEVFYSCRGFTGSLTIPGSVKTIGYSAFYFCNSFTGDLTIHTGVTAIGNWVFFNTNFSKVNLYWNANATILGYNSEWYLPDVTRTVPNGMKALYEAKSWTKIEERP